MVFSSLYQAQDSIRAASLVLVRRSLEGCASTIAPPCDNNIPSRGGGAGTNGDRSSLDAVNSTTTTTGGDDSSSSTSRPPLDVVRDVVLIFLAGIGIVVALMVFTYVLTLLVDKLRSWMGHPATVIPTPRNTTTSTRPSDDEDDDTDNQSYLAASTIVRGGSSIVYYDAGMRGLTNEERRKLLRHILRPTLYQENQQLQERGDDDVPPPPPIAATDLTSSPSPLYSTTTTPEIDLTSSVKELHSNRGVENNRIDDLEQGTLPACTTESSDCEETNSVPLEAVAPKTGVVDLEEACGRQVGLETLQDVESNGVSHDPGLLSTQVAIEKSLSGSMGEEEVAEEEGADSRYTCCICLSRYEDGQEVLQSHHCAHQFHWKCCWEWLERKDVCPYCRAPMFTSEELRAAGWEVLGGARMVELKHHRRHHRASRHAHANPDDAYLFSPPTHRSRGTPTEPGAMDVIVVHL